MIAVEGKLFRMLLRATLFCYDTQRVYTKQPDKKRPALLLLYTLLHALCKQNLPIHDKGIADVYSSLKK